MTVPLMFERLLVNLTRNISISADTVCSPSLHGASLEQKDTTVYPLPR